MNELEQEKELAARESLGYIQSGQVVGLGTGSTAAHLVRLLGEKVSSGLRIRAISTSKKTAELAASLGIPQITFEDSPVIDVAIDGADEIGPSLALIKGHGGALLREKIVASAARLYIVIGDSTKPVRQLGKMPLPVEVIPFAEALLMRRIGELGASPALRRNSAGGPFVTDEGHHILDCQFKEIADPEALREQLDRMPGVVEHGLFLGMADMALIGKGAEVVKLQAARRRAIDA